MLRRTATLLVALVLGTGLLPLAPAAAQQDGVTVEIQPAKEGDTAVRDGLSVTVSGSAPEGQISAARLVGTTDGDVLTTQEFHSARNRDPNGGSWIRNNDGTLEGNLVLGCQFNQPGSQHCTDVQSDIRDVHLEVTVGGAEGFSNTRRVDYDRPFIRRYDVVSENEITIVFSEPVRHNQGDALIDWRVEDPNRTVLDVAGHKEGDCVGEYQEGEDPRAGETGCTRTLTIAPPLGEDDAPFVRYQVQFLPDRQAHQDFASNQAFVASFGALSRALNRIRPPRPEIELVDGKEPSGDQRRVISNDDSPVARVSNVVEGHHIFFTVTRPDGSTFETEAHTADSDDPQDVALPNLGDDGTYTLHAVVEDPHGNKSTEGGKSTHSTRDDATTDAEKAGYLLDTVRPEIEGAGLRSAREILVTFSEGVEPSGDAGRWTVDGEAVTARQGSDTDERILDTSEDVTDGTTVSWAPTDGSTYRDRAGNQAIPRSGIPLPGLPPLPNPRVTTPSDEVYTSSGSQRVAGTVPSTANGKTIELLERGADTVLQSTTIADGSWSMDVSVSAERRHEFDVRVRNGDTGARGPRTAVPDIVRDATAPEVDVSEPSPRPLTSLPISTDRRHQFAIGDAVTVEWEADDPADDPKNPDHGDFVDIDLAFGDEAKRVAAELDHTPGQTRTYSYTVQEEDLAGATQREAAFRVGVTDLAGNRGTDTSSPILLISDLVGYVPAYVLPSSQPGQAVVEARFPELLDGLTTILDWEIDGQTPAEAIKGTRDGKTVVQLRASQAIDDPNARPMVRYTPVLPLERLRDGSREVSTSERRALDLVPPVLSIVRPSSGPTNLAPGFTVTVRGQTDETEWPNTVRVHRADADGRPTGGVVAQTTAGEDGSFQLQVGVTPNAQNRFVVRAVDPSGNESNGRFFSVLETSAFDPTDPIDPTDPTDPTDPSGPGFPGSDPDNPHFPFPDPGTPEDPNLPNILPEGGRAVSDDERVVVSCPPDAVAEEFFGWLVATEFDTPGYQSAAQAYEFVVESGEDRDPLAAFGRYCNVSYRAGEELLDGLERNRVALLRDTDELGTRVASDRADGNFMTPGTFTLGEADGPTVRVFGADPAVNPDRFATAAGMSQSVYAQAGTAVVARSDDYADALAASVLADQVGGPVLLSRTDRLPDTTMLELLRLRAQRVVLVGGPAALAPVVAEEISDLGLTVERVAGVDRYETATRIADRVGTTGHRVFLATGQNFPDALSASSPSAFAGQPILLTRTAELPDVTREALRELGVTHVDILGGPNAVAPAVSEHLEDEGFRVRRLAGEDRYETAVEVAEAFRQAGMPYTRPVIASGQGDGFTSPDALTAGPVAAHFDSPLLLTRQDDITQPTNAALRTRPEVRGLLVSGGPMAIDDATRRQLDDAAR